MTASTITVHSATPWGLEARPITITLSLTDATDRIVLRGIKEQWHRETIGRIQCALKKIEHQLPERSILVDVHPDGTLTCPSHLDLAIALGIMGLSDLIPQSAFDQTLIAGELNLDGTIRQVRSGYALVALACDQRKPYLIVPQVTAEEAACDLPPSITLVAPRTLHEASMAICDLQSVDQRITPPPQSTAEYPDFHLIRGSEALKRALEVAAAGGHHPLILEHYGANAQAYAMAYPGILPDLNHDEALELARINARNTMDPPTPPIFHRPFRAPHCVTEGRAFPGSRLHPGEVVLAHQGVLYLSDVHEFKLSALRELQRPIEKGIITIPDSTDPISYPAHFTLIASAPTCPCRKFGNPSKQCTCKDRHITSHYSHLKRVAEMLGFDMMIELHAPTERERRGAGGEHSAEIKARVSTVRAKLAHRYENAAFCPTNYHSSWQPHSAFCHKDAKSLLTTAKDRLSLSRTEVHRTFRLAKTIADLDGSVSIRAPHIGEAIQYCVRLSISEEALAARSR